MRRHFPKGTTDLVVKEKEHSGWSKNHRERHSDGKRLLGNEAREEAYSQSLRASGGGKGRGSICQGKYVTLIVLGTSVALRKIELIINLSNISVLSFSSNLIMIKQIYLRKEHLVDIYFSPLFN